MTVHRSVGPHLRPHIAVAGPAPCPVTDTVEVDAAAAAPCSAAGRGADRTRCDMRTDTRSAGRPDGRRRPRHRLRLAGRDAGMTTAEYAVGTVAACGFGGILYKVLTSPEVVQLLRDVITRAFGLAF